MLARSQFGCIVKPSRQRASLNAPAPAFVPSPHFANIFQALPSTSDCRAPALKARLLKSISTLRVLVDAFKNQDTMGRLDREELLSLCCCSPIITYRHFSGISLSLVAALLKMPGVCDLHLGAQRCSVKIDLGV